MPSSILAALYVDLTQNVIIVKTLVIDSPIDRFTFV